MQQKAGVIAATSAYLIWGFLPLYWKLVEEVPAGEVLAHRIIWSLVLITAVLAAIGWFPGVWKEIRHAFSTRKSALGITAAAFVISCNWFIFVFAVNSDRVIEVSLGYYINPLINVLLATVFLKERLSKVEKSAFLLAAAGVILLTFHYGYVPWAALALALSFGLYGLIKKTVTVGAWAGLMIETLLMAPFALLFLFFFRGESGGIFHYGWEIGFLLVGTGAATALPLLLFATGAKRITFSLLGFLQYIAPTIMLVLGVFLFQEPFSTGQLISFLIVWTGLVLFTYSRSNATIKKRKAKEPNKNAG